MESEKRVLVLASASDIRRQILQDAGLRCRVEIADVDEELLRALPADEMARSLAQAKAVAVSARNPGDLVIGCDQVFTLNGEYLPKPKDSSEVAVKLRRLSGKMHDFHCGIALAQDGVVVRAGVERVSVQFHNLSDDEIAHYAASGEGVGCAGGYQLEGGGSRLIHAVKGSHFAVLGLPLHLLITYLRELDVLLDVTMENTVS